MARSCDVETDQVLIEGLRGPFAARHKGWSTGLVLGLDYYPLQWKVIALIPTTRAFVIDDQDGSVRNFVNVGPSGEGRWSLWRLLAWASRRSVADSVKLLSNKARV